MNMHELKQEALEGLKEAIEGEYYDHIEDGITEIADGCIPVYYGELIELTQSSNDLDFVDPYNPPSNIESIYDIISWNCYNELIDYLYQELEDIDECNLCEKHMIEVSEVYPEMCQACWEQTEEYQEG